jgi:hypothetical protein
MTRSRLLCTTIADLSLELPQVSPVRRVSIGVSIRACSIEDFGVWLAGS